MSKLADLTNEYKVLGIQDQIDYDKLYLYSIITHSTAVEGSTVTEVENQLLFDEGISPDKPIAEQLMNLDLKKAYEQALIYAEEHRDYTVELLCSLSAMVMNNTGTEYKTLLGNFSSTHGDLRRLNVTAGRGGKSYMSWQKVPARLNDFCSWLNLLRKNIDSSDIDGVYRLSFLAHYNLVYIHPWADGNGRMSRLVMNMIQYEFGVIPSIVKKDSRAEYIESLSLSQDSGDETVFLDFMVKHHCDNLQERIENFHRSLEDDTLNLENDTLNDTLKSSKNETEVYQIIKSDNMVSIIDITEKTGLSRPTVTRAIAALKERGFIRREGSKKTGHWAILR